MRRLVLAVLGLAVLAPSMMADSAPVKVVVEGDRVCLRAAPRERAEVICLVSANDSLVACEIGEEWVAVVPPATAAVYVASSWVSNGVVRGDGVYVRSGPGVSFSPLGYVQRGDRLEVRRSETGWLQVAPPPGIRVWIHRQFISIPSTDVGQARVEASAAAAFVNRSEAGRPQRPSEESTARGSERPDSVAVRSYTSPPPSGLVVSDAGQVISQVAAGTGSVLAISADPARYIPVYSGMMDRCAWAIRRPADYRVVGKDSKGRSVTVCFVVGEPDAIKRFLGRSVSVSGVPLGMHDKRTPIVSAGSIVIVGD